MRIGHASIDERGKIAGGAPGDQTKREVCIRNYYLKNWRVVLRPDSKALGDRMAQVCETACNNDNIGYSQADRNSLYKLLQINGFNMATVGKCNTDCSAFMTACAIAAGVHKLKYTGNAPTTRTMQSAFLKTGQFIALTDAKYLLAPDYLQRGDILINPGHHTVMILDDGAKIERDKPRNIKRGHVGADVKRLQAALNENGYNLEVDGIFGIATDAALRDYQSKNKLIIDGICGAATRGALHI